MQDINVLFFIVIIIFTFIALSVFFTFVPVMLWISALAAGVRVGIFTLIGMSSAELFQQGLLIP